MKKKKTIEHEHRYYDKPFMKEPLDTCIICGFKPNRKSYEKKYY
jgi:hypothetical protein